EGSRVRQIYRRAEISETYHCNFGLNRSYETRLNGELQFSGRDEAGEVRVLEISQHPFFVATLFQPERSALRGEVHPLILAFLQVVLSTCHCRTAVRKGVSVLARRHDDSFSVSASSSASASSSLRLHRNPNRALNRYFSDLTDHILNLLNELQGNLLLDFMR